MSITKPDPPKKYWWVVGIMVPIIVALIAVLPAFKRGKPSPLPTGMSITNNNFGSNMYFVTQVTSLGDSAKTKAAQQVIESATSLVLKKEYARAVTQLEQASVQSQFPSIYNNLGVLYANAGQYEKAQEAYKNALKIDSNDQAANFNLGLLEKLQGHSGEAETRLSKAPDLQKASSSGNQPTAAPDRPVAESTSHTQGVTAHLLELKQFQNTITAKIRFIDSMGKDQNVGTPLRNSYLLDEATQEQHRNSATSDYGVTVPANGSIDVWVKFGLPAESKSQYFSVVLGDGVLFEHIPIR